MKIRVKEGGLEGIVQYMLSQIPYVTPEEQAEWEKILETEPVEIDGSLSHEIEI